MRWKCRSSRQKHSRLQESQTRVRCSSTSEEGRNICSSRILHGPCHLKHSVFAKHLKNKQGKSCAPGKTPSKTTVDPEQHSRSKDHQRGKWQQQHSWIQIQDSWAWRVRPTTLCQLIRKYTCQMPPDYCDCQNKSAQKCG